MSSRILKMLTPITGFGFIGAWMSLAAAAGPGYDTVPMLISIPVMAICMVLFGMSVIYTENKFDKTFADDLLEFGFQVTSLAIMTVLPITLLVQVFHGINIEIILCAIFWLIPMGFILAPILGDA